MKDVRTVLLSVVQLAVIRDVGKISEIDDVHVHIDKNYLCSGHCTKHTPLRNVRAINGGRELNVMFEIISPQQQPALSERRLWGSSWCHIRWRYSVRFSLRTRDYDRRGSVPKGLEFGEIKWRRNV